MTFDVVSRRRVLQGTAALTIAGVLPSRPAAAKDTTIGFIYVGSRDDYGYNQAHAQGAAALKAWPASRWSRKRRSRRPMRSRRPWNP